MTLPHIDHQLARLVEANVDKAAQKSAITLALILEAKWNSKRIVKAIDILDKQNLPVQTVAKHKLGRLVKKIHTIALEKEDRKVVDKTDTVLTKWRRLISPKVPEVANQQQSKTDQTARLQLAIQHKPTTKPMVTPSSPSSGQSATSFQALLEKIGTKPTPSSNNITAKRTFESTGSRTKRVRFAQDPERIMCSFREMHIGKESTLSWYQPRRILIPDACKRPIVNQCTTTPTHHSACFTSRSHPQTPPYFNDDIVPRKYAKIIPLFEVDMSDDDEPCFQHSPDVVNSVSLLTGSLSSSYHPSPPSPSSHLLQTQHYSTYH